MHPIDWKQDTLRDGIILISGQHIAVAHYSGEPIGIPYLTGPADFNGKNPNETKYTDQPKACCKAGDILITVKGAGTGTIAIADKNYCISRQLMAVRPTRFDTRFIFYVLESNFERYNSVAAGLIPGITREDILSTPLEVPPIIEQEEIAHILLTWDSAIEKTVKLIKAKRLRHGALSNKLLSRKHKNVPLNKFLTLVVRDITKPDKPYWALGIRSHGKGTFRRFVENPNTVAMDTLYRIQHNDIIVNITFAWEGAIALVKETDEDCFVSHRFPTLEVDINKALPDYLRHVIIQKRFVRNLGLISPGGAGRNRVLNKKDFLNLKISLPEIKEQEKIGDVLNTSLKEIALLEAQLELLKKQKRGLMQKLLTGEWRVKVEEVLE